jgi:hypothetical protein
LLAVRCLDWFGATRENVQGRLPSLVKKAGFGSVHIVSEIMAPLGTMALVSATRAIG